MAIGIQDEHEELRAAVQGWAEARGVAAAVRQALDADVDTLPPYWGDLAAQGLLAIHLDEELGGQGAGVVELAVVAEELGRAAAVGPWDTTAVVAGVVAAFGSAGLAKALLPGLADGSLTATLAVPTAAPDGSPVAHTGLSGDGRPGRLAGGHRRAAPPGPRRHRHPCTGTGDGRTTVSGGSSWNAPTPPR